MQRSHPLQPPDQSFGHAIAALPEPAVFLTTDGRATTIVFANRAALAAGPDLVGASLGDFAASLRLSNTDLRELEQAVRHRRPTRLQLATRTGAAASLDVTPLPGTSGGELTMLRWFPEADAATPTFGTIADHIPDPVFVLELDGPPPVRIAYVNRAATSCYGYTAEEMLGQSILSLLDAPSTAALAPERLSRLRHGEVVTFEGVHRRKDGSEMPIEARACMITWHGQPAILAIDRDVSARQQTANELATAVDRLRLALGAGRMGIFDWDVATNRIVWSPFHFELFGYPPDSTFEVTFDHFKNRIHSDDWAALETTLTTARDQHTEYHHEARVVRPDGSVRWFSGTGRFHFDAQGRATRMLGVVRDETERHEAAATLRERTRLLTALIDGCPIGIQAFRPDGTSQRMNPAMQRLLGLPRPLADIETYDIRNDAVARRIGTASAFEQCVQGKPTPIARYEVDLTSPEYDRWPLARRRLVMDCVFFPVFDEDGRVASVVSFTWDVCDAVEAERTRQRLEEQLRHAQKLEAIAMLAGGVAHDFNNVLTAVLGFSDMLRGLMPRSDPNRDLVEQIKMAADRGASLTRQLLAFSRKQLVRAEVLDLATEVHALVPMLRRLVESNVLMQVHADPCGTVLVDRGQFQQVLLNLVVNARDAMPKGGQLTIRAGQGQLDACVPATRISITDTGTGMSDEVKAHLFEPFFTTKEPGRGTGLGLATVHGIVTQAGGRIELESTLGKGTTVHVLWPRHGQAAGAATPATPCSRREQVLVVDDDAVNRDLAAKILTHDGYKVLTAASGEDALARFADAHIDLLAVDVVMPGMDGQVLAAAMTVRRPALPVVFLSGYAGSVLSPGSLERPRRWFLQKPFSADQLVRTVHQAVTR